MYYICRTTLFGNSGLLFEAFAKPHKGHPISKAAMVRWIVRCIQTCYHKATTALPIPLKGHSTRNKEATLAFLGNILLANIVATWSTPPTFTKHYSMDIVAC